MKILSHPLSEESPLYGGQNSVVLQRTNQIAKGDSSNNTQLSLPAHSGTHIDSPYHFDPKGKVLEDYRADFWYCRSPWFIELKAESCEILGLERLQTELEKMPVEADILLIKTGFERYRNSPDTQNHYIFQGPGLSPEVGLWLRANRRLKMIGFDFISLSSYQNRTLGRETHRAFLASLPYENGKENELDPVLPIEDMHLARLSSIPEDLLVAPLFYEDADGSPVTVFANLNHQDQIP